jgi:uncharacterized protein YjiS (DUF1127 family)
MEMNMSTISSAPTAPQGAAAQAWARRLGATLERWLLAYMTWRLERAAIAQLWSMSDRELKDMGLNRSGILAAVRGDTARGRTSSRYY